MPDGTYGSEVIAKAVVRPNQWTQLTATYATPNGSANPTFFITTNSTIDFYFDEFIATGNSPSPVNMPQPANIGLKDIYARHFRVGNILNGTTANNANIQNLILLEYNSITAENEHKPDATMTRTNSTNTNIRAAFNTGAARIMDFCARNNIPMRGHVLFWHGQTPQWFFLQNINDATDYRNSANSAIPWASTATMNSRIDSYTQNIFALYRSQYPALNLYAYDVVNEFVRVSGTAGPRLPGFDLEGAGGAGAAPGNSPWQAIYGNTNTAWVRTCFEAARRHAPAHTKLFYNDYNEFDPTKRDYIITTFLRPLYTAGLLDGMGMQGHISADPSATHWSNLNRYREAMTKYAEVGPGFEVQITELDVVTNQGNDTDNSNFLSNQPSVYRAIFEHAISINANPSLGRFTAICMWGPDDGNSWITRRAGRSNSAPLLHDRSLNRKPAYTAVAGVVPESQWGDGKNPTFDLPTTTTAIQVTCNTNNLNANYAAGAAVPRPNVTCSAGQPGTAAFSIGGVAIEGWNPPGGTHQLYNPGTRAVVLNSLVCGTTTVIPSTPVSCGSFSITELSSSSNTPSSSSAVPRSSSSVGGTTAIAKVPHLLNSNAVAGIYDLRGNKVAQNSSLPSGVYLVKMQNGSVQRFVVK